MSCKQPITVSKDCPQHLPKVIGCIALSLLHGLWNPAPRAIPWAGRLPGPGGEQTGPRRALRLTSLPDEPGNERCIWASGVGTSFLLLIHIFRPFTSVETILNLQAIQKQGAGALAGAVLG